jgi:hypothetical protein
MKRRFCVLPLAVMLLAGGARAEDKATVSSVSGKVTFAPSQAAEFRPLVAGAEIPIGSRVRTGKDSTAVIIVVSGAAMQVAENSDLTIETLVSSAAKRKALVSLKAGTVSALIDPKRSKQTDFKIQTPQGVAAARGTFYGVTVKKGKTFVGVKKGKVGIAHTPQTGS